MIAQFFKTKIFNFSLPDMRSINSDDVARACARLFATADGRIVLDYFKRTVLLKNSAADISEAQLRHAEGQRAFVIHILRLMNTNR